MLKIAITGGIGSGKTYLTKIFQTLSVPVFRADEVGKLLYNEPYIIKKVAAVFPEIYQKKIGTLNLLFLAEIVFHDSSKLLMLNKIIHPEVMNRYQIWLKSQVESPYTLFESAILFESGLNLFFDKIIGVKADMNVRYKRVKARQQLTYEEFENRVKCQMNDQEKLERCHFVIDNSSNVEILPQVLEIDRQIKEIGK